MNVAISSRYRLIRESLACLLTNRGGMVVVSAEASPRECLLRSPLNPPQAVVVHREGVGERDLEYVLGAQFYGRFGIVLLSETADEEPGFDKMISLDAPPLELIEAIKEVASPEPPPRRRSRAKESNPLEVGTREYEVAVMVARGLNNVQIAEASGMKMQTVKNMVHEILRKLHCKNRIELALLVIEKLKESSVH